MSDFHNEYWAETRNNVLATVQSGISEVSDIIVAHPELSRANVSMCLTRLVRSGDLTRVRRGLYEAAEATEMVNG